MKKSTKRRIRKVTKFILGATAFISFMLILIFTGENDGRVFTNGECFTICVLCLALFGGSMYLFDKLFGGDYYVE